MSKFFKELWTRLKNAGEPIGVVFIILGVLALATQFILVRLNLQIGIDLLGVFLGLFSVGLGFIAIGMSAKLDKHVLKVLDRFEPQSDKVEPAKVQTITPRPVEVKTGVGKLTVEVGKPRPEKGSKEAAQKRLDEDTKKVGYVRGEVYQLKDGGWGIAWGGKYPL